MASPAPVASTSTTKDATPPVNRHALTPQEKQRAQLAKLLKDPSKPVYIPPPAKEKTIRPPREMMKNVQGSSAGAGSGEFHVYKANRRREYERLKIMEEQVQKETESAEFERKRKEREEATAAKTSKNRAKRMKKKERIKNKGKEGEQDPESSAAKPTGTALKKRRLVNGAEMVFKVPGHGSDSDEEDRDVGAHSEAEVGPIDGPNQASGGEADTPVSSLPIIERKITIIDSD